MTQATRQDFAKRLDRIAQKQGNSHAALQIGEGEFLPEVGLVRARKLARGAKIRKVAALVGAFGLGAVSWIWADWLRVQLALDLPMAQVLGIEALATLFAICLLRLACGLTGGRSFLVQLVGAAFACVTLHNAVHLWPNGFAMIYPDLWVLEALGATRFPSFALNFYQL